MAVFISQSLKRALRHPKNFQSVPIIIKSRQDIPIRDLGGFLQDDFKLEIGSVAPSMNMLGVIVPKGLLGEIASLEGVEEIHYDQTMYALEIPAPQIPFPDISQMFSGGPPTRVPMSLSLMADILENVDIRYTEEGWIPTIETIKVTKAHKLWEMGLDGTNVPVAILDTGCDSITPQINNTVLKFSTMKLYPSGDDENGHGTWCCTCVKGKPLVHPGRNLHLAGVAPGCTLSSWKVLGNVIGSGLTSDIMSAIDEAVAKGNRIISMSLGSSGRDDEETDPMVRQINNYGVTNPEVIFVIAAGNSGPEPGTIGVPGNAENAITVASWGIIDNDLAWFSSRGPTIQARRTKPDISAPGGGRAKPGTSPEEKIFSGSSIGSLLDGISDKVMDGSAPLMGTSMATPLVAGILAQAIQHNPSLTGADVKRIFKKNGVRSKSNEYGWGLIDATWFI